MDVRSLVRWVALQILYEIELSSDKNPKDILKFHDVAEIPQYDARLLGYLALRNRELDKLPKGASRLLTLQMSKPLDSRTSLEQILIDHLTENVPDDAITPAHFAELEGQVIMPDTEEFDLALHDLSERLPLKAQHQLAALVNGVYQYKSKLSAFISRHAADYPTDQMASIDLNILRIALFELGFGQEPPKVVINEAVKLAKLFGSDRSAAFVNGVLGTVVARYDDIKAAILDIETDIPTLAPDFNLTNDNSLDNSISLS